MSRSLISIVPLLAACAMAERSAPTSQAPPEEKAAYEMDDSVAPGAPPPPPPPPAASAPSGGIGRGLGMSGEGTGGGGRLREQDEAEPAVANAPADGAARSAPEEPAATRSWFPETFLFAPSIVTDEQGRAQVKLTVPDRLTTWRVLALAHDRKGNQAGDLTRFLGTLPVYVDPVLPPFLTAGDRVLIPMQLVNTTDTDWSGHFEVRVGGAGDARSSGTVQIPAGGSTLVNLPVSVSRSGELLLSARLGTSDAIEKTIPVEPVGQRLEQVQGGTLAGPRTISLDGPRDMDESSAQLRLVVFPGALSVLRRELERAGASDGSAAGDAHALLLAGTAPALLSGLGETADADRTDSLRTLSLQAAQRVIRHARAPDSELAATLLPAVAAHPDNPVLARMATRLADQLAAQQRPDGTFQGGGTTAQRMLVGTAEAVAAVASAQDEGAATRNARVRLSASAAFERNQGLIQDPYTAAAVLVSGAAGAELSEALRARVREAIVQQPDGGRVLPVPEQVQRGDGRVPSLAETTALAALALADDPQSKDIVADLAGSLLGMWRPSSGWGEGRANLLCTRAVTALLRDPLPDSIELVLERDGVEVRRGSLSGERRTELLVLDVPGVEARGSHDWTVRAEPAFPGLGFSLSLITHVPWPEPPAGQGVQSRVILPERITVGRRVALGLELAAPAQTAMEVELALPAGVQVDGPSLDALRDEGRIQTWEDEDGLLRLSIPPQEATRWTADLGLIPTVAGTLNADALRVRLTARPDLVFASPSPTWVVGG